MSAKSVTKSQAKIIYDLSKTFPIIKYEEKYAAGFFLRHEGIDYYGEEPSDLKSAAQKLIADLSAKHGTQVAFNSVLVEARKIADEEAKAEDALRLLEEEANRTPLDRAEIAWAELLDTTNDMSELVTGGASGAILLLGSSSDSELEGSLNFIQKEIIDTLLEFDDLPLYEGMLLATIADVIESLV